MHNHHILKKISDKTCNCIDFARCSLYQQCLTINILYQVVVSSKFPELKEKTYYGISELAFKLRYSNHLKRNKKIKQNGIIQKEQLKATYIFVYYFIRISN